jgi:hypothetical protein
MVSIALDPSPPYRLLTPSYYEQALTAALESSPSSSQMDPDIQTNMSFSRELSLALHPAKIAPPRWFSSDPFTLPVHGVETFQTIAGPMTKPDRPGSLSRIRTSADLPKEPTSSMHTHRGATALQSSDIVINSFPSASNHFIATRPRTSYRPIPDRRDANLDPNGPLECVLPTSQPGFSDVPAMFCENAKGRPAKPTLPPLPLLPRLLDPICERTQDSDDSLRVSRGSQKNRISNYYHVHWRPLDIPKLDYGLPDDFGEFI